MEKVLLQANTYVVVKVKFGSAILHDAVTNWDKNTDRHRYTDIQIHKKKILLTGFGFSNV